MEFDQLTVKQLRNYLRERNQKVTGTKDQLIQRARGADVLKIPTKDSESASSVPALSVNGNVLGLPLVSELKTGWTDDLALLPELSEKEIYNYLVLSTHRSGDSRPMKACRQLKAEIYYQDRHVHSIEIHPINDVCDHLYVRCLVIPSIPTTKTKLSPDHQVWLCLSKVTGHVHSAYCTCVAGAGESCNHVSALLFALADISQKKIDGLLACTSTTCQWNMPRKRKLQPMISDDLNLMSSGRKSILKRKQGSTTEEISTSTEAMNKCANNGMPETSVNLWRFKNKLNSHRIMKKCGWVVNTSAPSKSFQEPVDNLPQFPDIEFCFHDRVNVESEICKDIFITYFQSLKVNDDEAATIERVTRGQVQTEKWKEARSMRITSSDFGKIWVRKKTTEPDRLVSHILDYGSSFSSIHTQWGLSRESEARQNYTTAMKRTHKQLTVTQCGLIVNTQYPFLGASPDGLVSCEQCDKCESSEGLVEIKCPSVHRDLTPAEAASQSGFCCWLDGSEVKLKENHAFYFQVQGQMAVTNRKWCDFVVWTLKGMSVQRIRFNASLWQEMNKKLETFYLSAIIPELFTRRVQRGIPLHTH